MLGVKIIRKSPQELVVEENTVWISVFCALAAAVLTFAGIRVGKPGSVVVAGLFALFALVWVRKTTFTFDATQRVARWTGRKLFKTESGTISFDNITDIGTESTFGGNSGAATCRLTFLTPQGSIPMSSSYGGNSRRCDEIRQTILAFIKPEMRPPTSVPATKRDAVAVELELSVRSLLCQGRKIDAVTLVQTKEQIALTEAVARVNAIDDQMNLDE